MVMVGCTKHENIIGNMTSIIPSTTTNTTSALPSYKGKISLARPGQGPAEVWADKYDVYPNVLTVTMGTTVTFKDLDSVEFTCISDEGLFAGDILPNGGTWSYLFKDPGTFGYSFNLYEGDLNGVVIVLE